MLTDAQLLSDQGNVFSDFPTETVTIDGSDYAALVIENRQGSEWDVGGEVPVKNIRVAIEHSSISTTPTEGLEAAFRGVDYRVGQVEQDDLSASITVELRNPTL